MSLLTRSTTIDTYMDNTGLDNSTSPKSYMDFYLHVKQIHLVEFGIRWFWVQYRIRLKLNCECSVCEVCMWSPVYALCTYPKSLSDEQFLMFSCVNHSSKFNGMHKLFENIVMLRDDDSFVHGAVTYLAFYISFLCSITNNDSHTLFFHTKSFELFHGTV